MIFDNGSGRIWVKHADPPICFRQPDITLIAEYDDNERDMKGRENVAVGRASSRLVQRCYQTIIRCRYTR